MMPNWYGDSMLSPPGAEHRMNTTGKTPEKFNKMQDLERLNSNQVTAPCSKADLEQAAFRQMTTSKSTRSSSPTANATGGESSSKIDATATPSADKKTASTKKTAAGATTDAKDAGPSDRIKIPEDKDGKSKGWERQLLQSSRLSSLKQCTDNKRFLPLLILFQFFSVEEDHTKIILATVDYIH